MTPINVSLRLPAALKNNAVCSETCFRIMPKLFCLPSTNCMSTFRPSINIVLGLAKLHQNS